MRVIEPHKLKKPAGKPVKKTIAPKTSALILIALVGIAGYLSVGQRVASPEAITPDNSINNNDAPSIVNEMPKQPPKKFKIFSDQEFKNLYNSASYPNTQQLSTRPEITGNEAADNRIQQLAESRGYKLSAVPVSSIVRLNEQYLSMDDLIQPHALLGWQAMENRAKDAGIPLQITSAYRSIEFQRELFLDILFARGAGVLQIASASADSDVLTVLQRVAPPGYSRHHTGYTIDLACDGLGLEGFIGTVCYEWLSKDNFLNAKSHGWVPSYPEEAKQQGPEPEAWEYIWVGTEALVE